MAKKIKKNAQTMRLSGSASAQKGSKGGDKGAVRIGRIQDYEKDPMLIMQIIGAAFAFLAWFGYVGQALVFKNQLQNFTVELTTLFMAGIVVGLIVRNISQAVAAAFLGLIMSLFLLQPVSLAGISSASIFLFGLFFTQISSLMTLVVKGLIGLNNTVLIFAGLSIIFALVGVLSMVQTS